MYVNKFAKGIVVVGAALISAAALSQEISTLPGVSAVPVLPSAESAQKMPQPLPYTAPAVPLRFRDSATPLTIGEMSDMAAKKSATEFLAKHGYTDVPTPKPTAAPTITDLLSKAKVATTDAQKSAPIMVQPDPTIKLLSVWGGQQSMTAEVLVDDEIIQLHEGMRFFRGTATVSSISKNGLLFTISTTKKVNGRKSLVSKTKNINVGESAGLKL